MSGIRVDYLIIPNQTFSFENKVTGGQHDAWQSCITLLTGFRLSGSWTRMLRRSDWCICRRRDTRKPHLCCCSPTAPSAQGSCCTDPRRDRGWLQVGGEGDRQRMRQDSGGKREKGVVMGVVTGPATLVLKG